MMDVHKLLAGWCIILETSCSFYFGLVEQPIHMPVVRDSRVQYLFSIPLKDVSIHTYNDITRKTASHHMEVRVKVG